MLLKLPNFFSFGFSFDVNDTIEGVNEIKFSLEFLGH